MQMVCMKCQALFSLKNTKKKNKKKNNSKLKWLFAAIMISTLRDNNCLLKLCICRRKQEAQKGVNRSTGKYNICFFLRFLPPEQ